MKTRGFTLIEMILFIVIMGVIATGLMVAFQEALKSVPESADDIVAMNLAQSRLDFILGQKSVNGYASFADTCLSSPPAICSIPTGYTVSSTINKTYDGNADLATVTVTVTGKGRAQLETLVGDNA